jgi:hypothetical protein
MIIAVMLYPDDELGQIRYASMRLANLLDENGTPELLELKYSRVLWDAPSREDISDMGLAQAKRGMAAGEVVWEVRNDDDNGVKEASINRSLKSLSKWLSPESQVYVDRERPKHISKGMLRKDFEYFRPAGHLWAAAVYFQKYHPSGWAGIADPHSILFDNIPFFLAVAENYRHFGENWVAKRRSDRVSLLDAATTWKVPKLNCPYELPSVEIEYGEENQAD